MFKGKRPLDYNRDKHLPKTDERIYKDASKLLCTEFASILNIDSKEILSLILDTTD
ncbi:MAG: hypothetical protein IJD68_00735 [Ruminococcus sp.]|nr:hypothetical protein [Ruminococcus sp.]